MIEKALELQKHLNPEALELLKQAMKEMLHTQEMEEKEHYAEFCVSPVEAVNIIEAGDNNNVLTAQFGMDVARYYNSRTQHIPTQTRALFLFGELISAGIIIGKRQARRNEAGH